MSDEIRLQLEQLMSTCGSSPRPKSFNDPDVCKYFLCGLCPHDLFANTKMWMGNCKHQHSDELKEAYLNQPDSSKRYWYEEESLQYIKPLIDDCDRKIQKQMTRCDPEDVAALKTIMSERNVEPSNREIHGLDAQIQEKMKIAEALGSEGEVNRSMEVMEEVSKLQERRAALVGTPRKGEDAMGMWYQKLRPCETCGALLSERDDESRINEHYNGRIHLGFDLLRKQVVTLQEKIASRAQQKHEAMLAAESGRIAAQNAATAAAAASESAPSPSGSHSRRNLAEGSDGESHSSSHRRRRKESPGVDRRKYSGSSSGRHGGRSSYRRDNGGRGHNRDSRDRDYHRRRHDRDRQSYRHRYERSRSPNDRRRSPYRRRGSSPHKDFSRSISPVARSIPEPVEG